MLLTVVGPLRFRPTLPAGPALALTLFTLGTVLSNITTIVVLLIGRVARRL